MHIRWHCRIRVSRKYWRKVGTLHLIACFYGIHDLYGIDGVFWTCALKKFHLWFSRESDVWLISILWFWGAKFENACQLTMILCENCPTSRSGLTDGKGWKPNLFWISFCFDAILSRTLLNTFKKIYSNSVSILVMNSRKFTTVFLGCIEPSA